MERGLAARFAPDPVPAASTATQAEYEVAMICQMGFPGYFLVVADLVRHAKEVGIRVGPGRGSAAGALIAWALGITELDPLKHGLLFERFLNPERMSMPDIDIDFDERRRGEMIQYATDKYGSDRVAQIVTYGTIKAKAAIKDSARVLGLPFSVSDRITKAMPPAVMGKDIPLSGIFDDDAQALRRGGGVPRAVRRRRDGPADRRPGPRAGGPEAPGRRARRRRDPVRRAADGRAAAVAARRRHDHHAVRHGRLREARPAEDGLPGPAQPHGPRRLPAAHRGQHRQRRWSWRSCRWTTSATYELLARGDTLGVFQLDGGPMRQLLRSMAPDNFEDISAVLALYRPGPDGRQRAQRLRRPQERPQARGRRCTRSWPSRWRRSSATRTS